MEKLLNWSIAQQSNDQEAKDRIGAPDPKLLAQLFGAQADEPTLMKQNMDNIINEDNEIDNRLVSCDNFEMLIENLDNANNIENLKLWEPLLNLLNDSNLEIVCFACSIIGTSVQNNPTSQNNYLKYASDGNHGMTKLIDLSVGNYNDDVQLKALYALSNIIRHNNDGYKLFSELEGWQIVTKLLHDNANTQNKLKLRTLSLINSLLSVFTLNEDLDAVDKDEKLKQIHDNQIVRNLLKVLNFNKEDESDKHIGCIDMTLSLLSTLISNKYKFDEEEMDSISTAVKHLETIKDEVNEDDYQVLKSVVS